MIKTPICDLLGIEKPVFQGGMAWIADASLASAVSEAGGLGIISAMNANAEWLRGQIQELRSKTDKPFGVNIMLQSPFADEVAQLVVDEKVPVVVTGAGDPRKYMKQWIAADIKVIPVVAQVALARMVERAGATAVVAEGGESGAVARSLEDLAMKMVEQFMLEANEAVAEMFCKAKIPFEYRIHDVPPADKLLKAQGALSNLGVALNVAGKQVTPHEVAQAVGQAENLHVEEGAGMIIVRSMARAAYSTECKGHFGLAAKYYCHFTSPIRRYPDTQIHRIIHEYLDGTLTEERKAHYSAILPGVSALNSKAERKSATAELTADKIKVCEWLADHVGEAFDATVSGVTKKGVFATIRGVMEGMIPMRAFGDSMMSDENGFSATDEWSGRRVYVGLPVRIRVRAADPAKKQADFDLLGFPAA